LNLQEEYYTIVVRAPKIEIPEVVTITGIVKNVDGTPLSNAKVRADYGKELLTDNNGAFTFSLTKEQVAAQNIYVSYDGLVTEIRSYHPSMINTDYDITLHKPIACCKKIKHCEEVNFKSFTIDFKINNISLSENIQSQLDEIAASLKECPTGIIHLTLHTDNNKSLQRNAVKQLDAVKNYLIEHNGIASDRIKTEEIIDGAGKNTIDVTAE
jgi:outer membrane protein OmpA-like peptidoglycan-associated protein